jgi:N-acetylglucosaminyl-diphospho-decaprenol L-rhamnosyltransferase
MSKSLAVVIVSWNTRELLRDCVQSVLAEDVVAQVVVVDNASHDGSAAMIQHEFPQVMCIAEATNHGFAKGNNIGLRVVLAAQTPPTYVCTLNPDTVVLPGALAQLVAVMDADPTLVGCGPQLRYGDGQWQSSRRRFPTIGSYLCESTPIAQYWPQNLWRQRYLMTDVPVATSCRADWLVGAAVVVRSSVVQQRGLFDEGFQLYSEEIEWQRRLTAAQPNAIAYVAEAVVTHFEGQSSAQIPAQRLIWFFQSRIRDAYLAFGAGVALLVRLGLVVMYVCEWLLEAGKWVAGHKRELRAHRMQTYAKLVESLLVWRMHPAKIW